MSAGNAVAWVTARSYAAVVYLSCLILYFFAATFLLLTHAPGAAGVPLLVGACYAALAPLIWSGHRSAMVVAFAMSIAAVAIVTSESSADWWLGLPFVVIFGAFTAVSIAAGIRPVAPVAPSGAPGAKAIAKVIAEVYAAAVYVYGFVIVVLWWDSLRGTRIDPWDYADPRRFLYVLSFALVVSLLCIPIWRARVWAMIAALALGLIHLYSLATLNVWFWTEPWYVGAPVVFGTLTVLYLIAAAIGRAKQA